MTTLHKQRAVQARRSRDTQRALYRNELWSAATDRQAGFAQADEAGKRIAQLLPGALQAGISVAEAADLTGISRPTLYRMLADARQQQDLRGLATQFEDALERLAGDQPGPVLPAQLAEDFHISLDEVFEALMQLYRPLAAEVTALGPLALTTLGDLLLGLGTPEKIVLNMLLLQRRSAAYVASSTQLSPTRVLGWAALGLLRVLPELRARSGSMRV